MNLALASIALYLGKGRQNVSGGANPIDHVSMRGETMSRTMFLFLALGAFAVACLMGVPAQADLAVPMVYDNTTSTVMSDWTCDGPPTAGSVVLSASDPPAYVTQGTSSTGLPAKQGSGYVESSRTSSLSNAWVVPSTMGASDAWTLTFAEACKDSHAYMTLNPETSAGAGNMGEFYFTGTGLIQYYNGGWNTLTGTNGVNNLGAWNSVVLTHTNGTGIYGISVNGAAPQTVTFTTGYSAINSVPYDFEFANANDGSPASVIALDAVKAAPEPLTLVLLGIGGAGLLAYAWRKRR